MEGATYRSPDRDDVMLRDYPCGVASYVILVNLNALPGKVLNMSHIADYAQWLKLRRPSWYLAEMARYRGVGGGHKPTPPTRVATPISHDVLFKAVYAKPERGGHSPLTDTMINTKANETVSAPIRDPDIALSWGRRNGLRGNFGLNDVNKLRLKYDLTPFSLQQ